MKEAKAEALASFIFESYMPQLTGIFSLIPGKNSRFTGIRLFCPVFFILSLL